MAISLRTRAGFWRSFPENLAGGLYQIRAFILINEIQARKMLWFLTKKVICSERYKRNTKSLPKFQEAFCMIPIRIV